MRSVIFLLVVKHFIILILSFVWRHSCEINSSVVVIVNPGDTFAGPRRRWKANGRIGNRNLRRIVVNI
jgi:hypothetical protein